MNGVHDMGGMHGFGRVPFENNQATFHHEWERKVWGLVQASTYPDWLTLDRSRHTLERMPPALYLSYSYFERWLYGLTTKLLEGGLIAIDEVKAGKAAAGTVPRTDASGPDSVNPYAHREYRREIDAAPLFKPGERVRTKNLNPAGHTRLPRYARDKVGAVHLHHGAHVLPDANAHSKGESPLHLYTVGFSARDLWGPEAGARDMIFLDIWECHLEQVK
ncbi:MAG TPA: nitrile hydratase subunit beta [Gammaproteobacteria bacterium]|nr:nitrile hydratase subunit beta [Gammaproteobacteria bacterium]